MLPTDLPGNLPSFLERFGTGPVPGLFVRGALGRRVSPCGLRPWPGVGAQARLIYECAACGKQHSLLAGTIFEQTKTGLAKWFLAIYLVTSSKGGISAMELRRQMGFGSYQTAWTWLHKIRKAMVRPDREPLAAQIEVDETYVGGPAVRAAVRRARPRSPGPSRAPAARPGDAAWAGCDSPWCPTSRPDFLATAVARPATVATDGWSGYGGLAAAGYDHAPLNLSATWGDASWRLPAIHLVFGLAKRWLLGTHHGAVSKKHPAAYLDEFVFRFNRRTAKRLSHRFPRVIEYAVQIRPTTYRALVAASA